MDLVCVGEMLVDFTPTGEPETYRANPGGAPANVAVAAARSGLSAGFAGKVGDDHFGRMLASVLAENDVANLCPEPTDEAATTMAFVTLDENGERSFSFARKPGADMLLQASDIRQIHLASTRMVHAGSCSLSAEPARKATLFALSSARLAGVATSFDVNYRAPMWQGRHEHCVQSVMLALKYVDFLKVSDDEAWLFGGVDKLADRCFTRGVRVLVETRGSEGARLLLPDGTEIVSRGWSVDAVDTTGAGDAFWGAFLSHLLLEGPEDISKAPTSILADALECANAAGALCVQGPGAIPSIPTRAAVLELAASRG